MSRKVWLGGIYLKEEGGYDLVLRALYHYKKRLKNIGRSPELKGAPMFAQLVQHEASKIGPLIEPLINKLKEGLQNPQTLRALESDIPILEKALTCYKSDIQKLQANSDQFYSELISNKDAAVADLANIQTALDEIARFAYY